MSDVKSVPSVSDGELVPSVTYLLLDGRRLVPSVSHRQSFLSVSVPSTAASFTT